PPCGRVPAGRKTLTTLALREGVGGGRRSRDKLSPYLWPETGTEHGRGLLKQACYALRRDLGAPELFLGSIELRLNPGLISSDVESFEGALDQHDPARAVSLYRGPFLDGFYLNGEGDFGRWVEGERARLAKLMSDALQSLACAASERGEHRTAADWWRRLAELDPFSSRAALGLMTALEALGERACGEAGARRGAAYWHRCGARRATRSTRPIGPRSRRGRAVRRPPAAARALAGGVSGRPVARPGPGRSAARRHAHAGHSRVARPRRSRLCSRAGPTHGCGPRVVRGAARSGAGFRAAHGD